MSTFISSLDLILIGFAMIYPIYFLFIYKSLQNNAGMKRLLQINYLLHLLAGCTAVLLFWIYSVNYPLQLSGAVYLLVIIVVVLYYWKVAIPRWNMFNASVIFGFLVFIRAIREIVQLTPVWPGVLMGLLSTGIISIATLLFVLTLWNFIKNDGSFPLPSMLQNLLICFITIRLLWDLVVLFNIKIEDQNGNLMNVINFFTHNTMIHFSLTMFFGIFAPLTIAVIISRQIKLVNNKKYLLLSFGLLISIWFGEFLFKFFLFQYGIVL